jgi:hypothetical protein
MEMTYPRNRFILEKSKYSGTLEVVLVSFDILDEDAQLQAGIVVR